jgi:hypothetical protein
VDTQSFSISIFSLILAKVVKFRGVNNMNRFYSNSLPTIHHYFAPFFIGHQKIMVRLGKKSNSMMVFIGEAATIGDFNQVMEKWMSLPGSWWWEGPGFYGRSMRLQHAMEKCLYAYDLLMVMVGLDRMMYSDQAEKDIFTSIPKQWNLGPKRARTSNMDGENPDFLDVNNG